MTRDQAILCYNLFEGDRDSDVTIFSNKMLVSRKQHTCVVCREDIAPKTRVRAQTERDNDDKIVMTFYVCETCCSAIVELVLRGNDEPISTRTALGMGK
ncbi:hypothetical protein [Mesorhizobium sp.]|uniref:hypothetical protein n=1 Tax=Mesorhizobium sp. TaxID=1871066 RepID=UPI000FE5104B|nr:hypothetical protein [Mesorhizobium sp.]RWP69512.1 MAG: hypothetical protein EOR07_03025 [Mesorhizobium sp.]